jgi:hypothetical protein
MPRISHSLDLYAAFLMHAPVQNGDSTLFPKLLSEVRRDAQGDVSMSLSFIQNSGMT